MQNSRNHHLFLLICLSASIVFAFFIVQPFLVALIMAGVFAFLFQPLYLRMVHGTKGRHSLSAFLITIIAIVLVVMPIIFLGTIVLKEATSLYQNLSSGDSNIIKKVENMIVGAQSAFPLLKNVELDFGRYASQGLEALAQNIGAIFSSFAKIILNSFVFLTAFYFFLKDGKQFSKYLILLSPLDDKDDLFIISRLKTAVQATVKGSLTIGFIQGVLTGLGFAIFGVPNPVLWGSVAAIAALIPGVGTALIIIPSVIYLFVSGQTYSGIGLGVWGTLAVGMIDNFLSPKLVGRGMQLHPLAVFVSVLGGMALFGPLGFIFGPLAISISLALMDIYASLKKHNDL